MDDDDDDDDDDAVDVKIILECIVRCTCTCCR